MTEKVSGAISTNILTGIDRQLQKHIAMGIKTYQDTVYRHEVVVSMFQSLKRNRNLIEIYQKSLMTMLPKSSKDVNTCEPWTWIQSIAPLSPKSSFLINPFSFCLLVSWFFFSSSLSSSLAQTNSWPDWSLLYIRSWKFGWWIKVKNLTKQNEPDQWRHNGQAQSDHWALSPDMGFRETDATHELCSPWKPKWFVQRQNNLITGNVIPHWLSLAPTGARYVMMRH